jgi:predicted RNA-binding protein with PIN domain
MGALGLRSCGLAPGLKSALEPLWVIAGFLVFGLAWATWLGAWENRVSTSQDSEEARGGGREPTSAPQLWLVDGYNVLHAGVLRGRDRRGWWTASVQSRLVAIADTFEDRSARIIVVFDGRDPDSPRAADPAPTSRVELVYAPSADDWLVRHVRSSPAPERIAVVTADRQVQGRARHGGARVVSPLAFLARCNRSAGAPDAGRSGDVGG